MSDCVAAVNVHMNSGRITNGIADLESAVANAGFQAGDP